MKTFRLHLVLPVQVQIRIESDRHNKIPRYVSNSFKFFYHLIESIPAEEEVETEVGTTIMEVDIEVVTTEDMDVVGTADEAVDMEIIAVDHIVGITGLDLIHSPSICDKWHCTTSCKHPYHMGHVISSYKSKIQIVEGVMVIIIVIIVTSRTEQNIYCQKYFLQIMNS